jgi:hypothetical protein
MRTAEDVRQPLTMRDLPTIESAGKTVLTDSAAATLVDRLIVRESELLERLAAE